MSLLSLVVILLLVGVGLFLINKYGSEIVDPKIIRIINAVVIVVVIIWLIGIFLGWGRLDQIKVPQLK